MVHEESDCANRFGCSVSSREMFITGDGQFRDKGSVRSR